MSHEIFRLMLGLMSTTAFLSMWISNTATTAMMVPIIDAIIFEIGDECKEGHEYGLFICRL